MLSLGPWEEAVLSITEEIPKVQPEDAWEEHLLQGLTTGILRSELSTWVSMAHPL